MSPAEGREPPAIEVAARSRAAASGFGTGAAAAREATGRQARGPAPDTGHGPGEGRRAGGRRWYAPLCRSTVTPLPARVTATASRGCGTSANCGRSRSGDRPGHGHPGRQSGDVPDPSGHGPRPAVSSCRADGVRTCDPSTPSPRPRVRPGPRESICAGQPVYRATADADGRRERTPWWFVANARSVPEVDGAGRCHDTASSSRPAWLDELRWPTGRSPHLPVGRR